MSSVTLSNSGHAPVFTPARPGAASLVARVLGWLGAQWASATAPKPSRTLTPHEEAEQIRAMALDWQDRDPGFAQDLYAAADRHEGQ